MPSPLPPVTVHIGFDTGGSRQSLGTAYSSVVWTDVTTYVLAKTGVRFSRGRAEAGMAAAAGQLSVSFDNSDGRFTPGTTGGAYGPVRTRMPIKVTAYTTAGTGSGWFDTTFGSEFSVSTDGTGSGPFDYTFAPAQFDATTAVATTLWLGFVTDIDWQMVAGQPVISMQAADIVAAAARTKCGPWFTKRVLSLPTGLINYWPLTDTAPNAVQGTTNTAVPVAVGDTARAAYGGTVATVAGDTGAALSFNVVSDLSPDPTTEPVFSFTPTPVVGTGKYLATTATLDATGDMAVSLWVKPTTAVSVCLLAVSYTGTNTNTFGLHTTSGGVLRVAADYTTGAEVTFGALAVDEWSHIYLQRDNSETAPASRFRLWVDGVERTGTPSGTMTSATNTGIDVHIGGDTAVTNSDFDGLMAHVALWNTLDTSRVAFLASYGWGATCATRFGELHYQTPNPVGLSSWLTADTEADNLVSPQAADGKSLLQVAEEVADAERGSVIATRSGKLRLLAQRYFIAPAAVSLTVAADRDILSLANTFGVDDSANLNECVVTLQPSGWRYTATRAVDPGVESTTLEMWSPDTYFASVLATFIANADTERPRAPSLTLSMEWLAFADKADATIGLELGDTIRVTGLPSQAPASSLTLQIRTISHTITAGGWLVNIDTDPPVYGAVLNDADRGVLNQTAYLGA